MADPWDDLTRLDAETIEALERDGWTFVSMYRIDNVLVMKFRRKPRPPEESKP